MKGASLFAGASLVAGAMAQGGAYAQCGGTGWAGATTCVSGYHCVYSNPYYSQCLPGAASVTPVAPTTTQGPTSVVPPPTTLQTSTTVSSAPGAVGTTAKFKWFGVDESGAEFGSTAIPGVYNKDFTFPSNQTIDVSVPRNVLRTC